jgi:hypothetical protein
MIITIGEIYSVKEKSTLKNKRKNIKEVLSKKRKKKSTKIILNLKTIMIKKSAI